MAEGVEYKVLMIGSTKVGKTVLLSQYCDKIFNEGFTSTVGIDFRVAKMSR